ncbi:MAG: hypothetical protein ABR878_16020 [Roseiarcus sp.]
MMPIAEYNINAPNTVASPQSQRFRHRGPIAADHDEINAGRGVGVLAARLAIAQRAERDVKARGEPSPRQASRTALSGLREYGEMMRLAEYRYAQSNHGAANDAVRIAANTRKSANP